jgi:hypothetical protein
MGSSELQEPEVAYPQHFNTSRYSALYSLSDKLMFALRVSVAKLIHGGKKSAKL